MSRVYELHDENGIAVRYTKLIRVPFNHRHFVGLVKEETHDKTIKNPAGPAPPEFMANASMVWAEEDGEAISPLHPLEIEVLEEWFQGTFEP